MLNLADWTPAHPGVSPLIDRRLVSCRCNHRFAGGVAPTAYRKMVVAVPSIFDAYHRVACHPHTARQFGDFRWLGSGCLPWTWLRNSPWATSGRCAHHQFCLNSPNIRRRRNSPISQATGGVRSGQVARWVYIRPIFAKFSYTGQPPISSSGRMADRVVVRSRDHGSASSCVIKSRAAE